MKTQSGHGAESPKRVMTGPAKSLLGRLSLFGRPAGCPRESSRLRVRYRAFKSNSSDWPDST